MPRYGLKRYLGIVFIAVVIGPAIVLSLLAIRALSREEVYIEKQMEGTLIAEVAHVSTVVNTEMDQIETELSGTIVIPEGRDPSVSFDEWKRKSVLVETPFLLSPTHEILWPVAGEAVSGRESSFLEAQEAFLSDEEEVPVYENIAVAYQNEILGEERETSGARLDADKSRPGPVAKPPEPEIALLDTFETRVRSAAQDADQVDDVVTGVLMGDVEKRRAVKPDTLGETRALSFQSYAAESGESAAEVREAEQIEGAYDFVVRADRPEGTRSKKGTREVTTRAIASEEEIVTGKGAVAEGDVQVRGGRSSEMRLESLPDTPTYFDVAEENLPGEQARRQAAISEFTKNLPRQQELFDKAKREGQQVAYRNIQLADAGKEQQEPGQKKAVFDEVSEAETESDVKAEAGPTSRGGRREEVAEIVAPKETETRPRARTRQPEPGEIGRLRSIFISEPLRFSEIVARGQSGIIPRAVDGNLELLYWQKITGGNIVGCLINSQELRDRIIGVLPSIYSPVRVLTVLDESGIPLIVPTGQGERDWRRPFVAEEISEVLPRWEIAAYLTDPDVISSRAQVTTMFMWILILILFISIAGGGVLVLRSAYAEVRLAQQKTTFVANVSHELKTPLTSIRMFAEMLRDRRQVDEQKRQHYLDIMTAETERLTRLINNVLDFARTERGEKRYTMKKCDIVDLCASVVDSQRVRLENNGFEVALTTHAGTLLVNADEEAMKQAVVNLLSNAEKYSTDVKQIEIGIRREDGSAVVSISDRGVGIPAGQVDRIFEEFFRVDDTLTSKVKGAGLGLTIARRILRDHGGDIRYVSREGGGSTFEIVLPIVEEQS
jgi:signal transduction histidine kinase